jgi:hypothetical protein
VNHLKLVFLSLVAVVVLLACKKDVGKASPVTPLAVISCDTITYTKHIKGFATKYCISCHVVGGSGGSDLSIYDNLKSRATSGILKERVLKSSPSIMPPSGSAAPSSAELNLIQCWIDNGAKEK